MKAVLIKESTLEGAAHPQEDRYPSGKTIREGYVKKHYKPIVDSNCILFTSEEMSFIHFYTSKIKKILSNKDNVIRFTTLNSTYRLILIKE